tara:strand:- start:4239 stop:4949 length:711 start_codon:yes stop_codon:yes gene_type:complete
MARSAKQAVTREYFDAIPTPEPTTTYAPVPFSKISRICDEVVGSISDQYESENVSYYVNTLNDEMLIQHRLYKDGRDLGLSFEAMGSHNKQCAQHFYGSNCVCWCNNGMQMADADVHWAGRHTMYKVTEIEDAAWNVLDQWQSTTDQAEETMAIMKDKSLDDNRFYEYTGLLYGHNVITPHQMPKVHTNWHTPRHEAFAPRTLWSAYNAVTEVFKGAPIRGHRERHGNLSSLSLSF